MMAKTLVGVTIKEKVTTQKSFDLHIKNEEIVQLLRECSVIPKWIEPDTVHVQPTGAGVRVHWSQTTEETT